jgi:hypothetical protein
MSEARETMGKRDRSPSFPFIPLRIAIERLAAFEEYHKRAAVPPDRVGPSWGMKTNTSQAQQTLAALRAYGLLEMRLTPEGRRVMISEDGRIYLRAQQDSVKQEVLRRAALRPKQIQKYWHDWGTGRPKDAACLDALVVQGGGFSEDGAEKFLKVYDDTIAYAGLAESDKKESDETGGTVELYDAGEEDDTAPIQTPKPVPSTRSSGKVRLMESERELTTGLLSKDANFRLIVSGHVGVKEIERLIQKLQFDKEILADQDEEGSLKEGTQVKISEKMGFSLKRAGQIGSVVRLYVLPGDGGTRADVSFEDGSLEKGIRVEELEVSTVD